MGHLALRRVMMSPESTLQGGADFWLVIIYLHELCTTVAENGFKAHVDDTQWKSKKKGEGS